VAADANTTSARAAAARAGGGKSESCVTA
jgi:hypothetical protein